MNTKLTLATVQKA